MRNQTEAKSERDKEKKKKRKSAVEEEPTAIRNRRFLSLLVEYRVPLGVKGPMGMRTFHSLTG